MLAMRTTTNAAPELDIGSLFDAHAEELCRMVHRLTGSREVAEDLVQEAFVTAWRKRDDLHDPTYVRAWLYKVALNHVRHRRRSTARLAAFLARFVVHRVGAEAEPAADEMLERQANAALIRETIAQLSPKLREVFVLYELQSLSGQEVADVLGVGVNTVWGRLRLARAAFKKAWEYREQSQ
jgi:RNA polymerase sigma-70 factor (ECF subfamily)